MNKLLAALVAAFATVSFAQTATPAPAAKAEVKAEAKAEKKEAKAEKKEAKADAKAEKKTAEVKADKKGAAAENPFPAVDEKPANVANPRQWPGTLSSRSARPSARSADSAASC